MNIIIHGTISNSLQLIGAIAAKNKLSEKYNATVYLKIEYFQYWSKNNISNGMLEIIEKEFIDAVGVESFKTYHLSINNPRVLKRNQIIIDDGVAAYRKNPLILLNAIKNERKFKNEGGFSIAESIKYVAIQSTKMLYSMLHPGHLSVFRKNLFNYFEIHEENKRYLLEAIEHISECLGQDYLEEKKKLIVFLSQPYHLLGFKGPEDYEFFIKKLSSYFKRENPSAIFFIKKHPVDSFDYSNVEAQISCDNDLPAEIYFYHNKENILKTVGFNSTSLLTGKVLFDIPGFYIGRNEGFSITGDFWVDRGFKKHLGLLKLS